MKRTITIVMAVIMMVIGCMVPANTMKAEATDERTVARTISDIVAELRTGENWEEHHYVYLTPDDDWVYVNAMWHGGRYHVTISVWYTEEGCFPVLRESQLSGGVITCTGDLG